MPNFLTLYNKYKIKNKNTKTKKYFKKIKGGYRSDSEDSSVTEATSEQNDDTEPEENDDTEPVKSIKSEPLDVTDLETIHKLELPQLTKIHFRNQYVRSNNLNLLLKLNFEKATNKYFSKNCSYGEEDNIKKKMIKYFKTNNDSNMNIKIKKIYEENKHDFKFVKAKMDILDLMHDVTQSKDKDGELLGYLKYWQDNDLHVYNDIKQISASDQHKIRNLKNKLVDELKNKMINDHGLIIPEIKKNNAISKSNKYYLFFEQLKLMMYELGPNGFTKIDGVPVNDDLPKFCYRESGKYMDIYSLSKYINALEKNKKDFLERYKGDTDLLDYVTNYKTYGNQINMKLISEFDACQQVGNYSKDNDKVVFENVFGYFDYHVYSHRIDPNVFHLVKIVDNRYDRYDRDDRDDAVLAYFSFRNGVSLNLLLKEFNINLGRTGSGTTVGGFLTNRPRIEQFFTHHDFNDKDMTDIINNLTTKDGRWFRTDVNADLKQLLTLGNKTIGDLVFSVYEGNLETSKESKQMIYNLSTTDLLVGSSAIYNFLSGKSEILPTVWEGKSNVEGIYTQSAEQKCEYLISKIVSFVVFIDYCIKNIKKEWVGFFFNVNMYEFLNDLNVVNTWFNKVLKISCDEVGRHEVGRDEVGRDEVGRDEVGRDEVGRDEVDSDKQSLYRLKNSMSFLFKEYYSIIETKTTFTSSKLYNDIFDDIIYHLYRFEIEKKRHLIVNDYFHKIKDELKNIDELYTNEHKTDEDYQQMIKTQEDDCFKLFYNIVGLNNLLYINSQDMYENEQNINWLEDFRRINNRALNDDLYVINIDYSTYSETKKKKSKIFIIKNNFNLGLGDDYYEISASSKTINVYDKFDKLINDDEYDVNKFNELLQKSKIINTITQQYQYFPGCYIRLFDDSIDSPKLKLCLMTNANIEKIVKQINDVLKMDKDDFFIKFLCKFATTPPLIISRGHKEDSKIVKGKKTSLQNYNNDKKLTNKETYVYIIEIENNLGAQLRLLKINTILYIPETRKKLLTNICSFIKMKIYDFTYDDIDININNNIKQIINTTPCLKYLLLLNKYYNLDTTHPNTTHTNTIYQKFEEIYNYSQYADAEILKFSEQEIREKLDLNVEEINIIKNKYKDNSQIKLILKLILNYISDKNKNYKIIDMLKNKNFINFLQKSSEPEKIIELLEKSYDDIKELIGNDLNTYKINIDKQFFIYLDRMRLCELTHEDKYVYNMIDSNYKYFEKYIQNPLTSKLINGNIDTRDVYKFTPILLEKCNDLITSQILIKDINDDVDDINYIKSYNSNLFLEFALNFEGKTVKRKIDYILKNMDKKTNDDDTDDSEVKEFKKNFKNIVKHINKIRTIHQVVNIDINVKIPDLKKKITSMIENLEKIKDDPILNNILINKYFYLIDIIKKLRTELRKYNGGSPHSKKNKKSGKDDLDEMNELINQVNNINAIIYNVKKENLISFLQNVIDCRDNLFSSIKKVIDECILSKFKEYEQMRILVSNSILFNISKIPDKDNSITDYLSKTKKMNTDDDIFVCKFIECFNKVESNRTSHEISEAMFIENFKTLLRSKIINYKKFILLIFRFVKFETLNSYILTDDDQFYRMLYQHLSLKQQKLRYDNCKYLLINYAHKCMVSSRDENLDNEMSQIIFDDVNMFNNVMNDIIINHFDIDINTFKSINLNDDSFNFMFDVCVGDVVSDLDNIVSDITNYVNYLDKNNELNYFNAALSNSMTYEEYNIDNKLVNLYIDLKKITQYSDIEVNNLINDDCYDEFNKLSNNLNNIKDDCEKLSLCKICIEPKLSDEEEIDEEGEKVEAEGDGEYKEYKEYRGGDGEFDGKSSLKMIEPVSPPPVLNLNQPKKRIINSNEMPNEEIDEEGEQVEAEGNGEGDGEGDGEGNGEGDGEYKEYGGGDGEFDGKSSLKMIEPVSPPPVLNLNQPKKRIINSNEMPNEAKDVLNNKPIEDKSNLKKMMISKNKGGKMTKKKRNKSK
jgi:hypothetical protein